MQRRQSDEEEVGEGYARHPYGEREFLRIRLEAGRDQAHELRREGEGENEKNDLRSKQKGEDLAGEMPGLVIAFGFQHARIGRHISGIEGALAENRAELVRQSESDKKSVGNRAGAEQGC